MTLATMLVFHSTSRVYLAPSMFFHALIRVSVLGVALPTSSAFISVEVTNLHGDRRGQGMRGGCFDSLTHRERTFNLGPCPQKT